MVSTGLQAMFPVYLARVRADGESTEEYNSMIAQNENNLNQNLESLYNKLLELEAAVNQTT